MPAPRSPVELQWNERDTRPLGFRLTKFRMAPAGPLQYRLGELIDLADGGNSAAFVADYVGSQWALPDSFGSWTLGPTASMKVRFQDPPAGALPASFVVSDCMVSKAAPKLTVRVKANGREVAEWEFRDREAHRRSIELPAEAVAGFPELILRFEISEPRSPASLGWSSDSRPLGIRVARAAIGRSDVEMPAFGKAAIAPRSLITRILGLPAFALHLLRLAIKKWDER
jgi:hypothetical protein